MPLLSHFPLSLYLPYRLSRSGSIDEADETPKSRQAWSPETEVSNGHSECSSTSARVRSVPLGTANEEEKDSEENEPTHIRAPVQLHSAFDPRQVLKWEESRFQLVQKLSDASRNRGVVQLMRDMQYNRSIAVKQMPNWWVRVNHEAFVEEHPTETEWPWQDLGCTYFLNSVGFTYACHLHDVYRSPTHTFVTTSFATEGDLFNWCQAGSEPGPERESAVAPIAVQILSGVKQLHDMRIVHRDISLENILLEKFLTNTGNPTEEIRIIDYSMASSMRLFRNCVRGKASYQAPELHQDHEYDAFLSDTFSVGVTLYAMVMMDYPWLSTKPGGCKCFQYVQKHGIRSYFGKRKVRGSEKKVGERMTEPMQQLLEGMLSLDPSKRLTLGESGHNSDRRSVWDEPWIKSAMKLADTDREKAVPARPVINRCSSDGHVSL